MTGPSSLGGIIDHPMGTGLLSGGTTPTNGSSASRLGQPSILRNGHHSHDYRVTRWIPVRSSKPFTPLQAIQMIFTIIALNILIAITTVTIYMIIFNINEIRLSSSVEILYVAIGFLSASIIKITQAVLCIYATEERTKRRIKFCIINLLFCIPILLLVWFSMNCADLYRTRVAIKLQDPPHVTRANMDMFSAKTIAFMRRFYTDHPEDFAMTYKYSSYRYAWDQVQIKYQCCGSNNYSDWIAAGLAVPFSCCPTNYSVPLKPGTPCLAGRIHLRGCFDIIHRILFEMCNQIVVVTMNFLVPIEIIIIIYQLCWLIVIAIKSELKARYRPSIAVRNHHHHHNLASYSVDMDAMMYRAHGDCEPPPSYRSYI